MPSYSGIWTLPARQQEMVADSDPARPSFGHVACRSHRHGRRPVDLHDILKTRLRVLTVTSEILFIVELRRIILGFILGQLDRAGLGHNTFTPEALALIVRSGEGLLRRTRNLCLGSLLETVRDQQRIVDLPQVNRVLMQPHWRKDHDNPPL